LRSESLFPARVLGMTSLFGHLSSCLSQAVPVVPTVAMGGEGVIEYQMRGR